MKVGTLVRLGRHGRVGYPNYSAVRDMARRMEAVGLNSIWLYDHLLYRGPGRPSDGIWECWTMLSALAEATNRVGLGTLVLCTPFRNPAVLAKMAVTLDEVSGGRLTLGIGAGWHQPEFDAFGVPFDHRAARLEEAIQIIQPLLRDGQVDFAGAYYEARDCQIIPKGPRAGGPPLLVAGNRPRMLRLAARYADSWNTAWHDAPTSAAERLETMHAACEREERDPTTLALTAGVLVAFPDLGDVGASNSLTGSAADVAEALRGYRQLGVSEVMIDFAPYTPAALDRIAEAVQLFRA
jgi:probable F420-dependent oxidoreductase